MNLKIFMSIISSLLPEYDHEMGTTRRLLERVPEAEFEWRPHDKSMSLGQLADHLSNLSGWANIIMTSTHFDLASVGSDRKPKNPASRDAVLARFDEKVAAARDELASKTDPELLAPWTLKSGTQEVFTMPRLSALRSFVLNHTIHHRGQLSVYLRLKNVPLPSIYGPTADEP
jgi:uncharacterized damage-inducible protein DinB